MRHYFRENYDPQQFYICKHKLSFIGMSGRQDRHGQTTSASTTETEKMNKHNAGIRVSDNAQIDQLFAKVILGAVADMLFGDPIKQIEGLEFLTSDDLQYYTATMPDLDLSHILEDPDRARKIYKQGR